MKIIIFLLLFVSGFCGMTVEEKVGQVLVTHCREEDAGELVGKIGVGGIIYYEWANDLSLPDCVRTLSEKFQQMAKIPLLIMVDQEGGRVCRLKEGFSVFPSQCVDGEVIGRELLDVGINMNLAPVIDVAKEGSVMFSRCFSDDPKRVVNCGREALIGYWKAGVISTLKHFPGHGDVIVDSHYDLPIVFKSMEEMELLPFKELAPMADCVMTAHILVPALDCEHCATLSKQTIDYLREEIGFSGVVITDSLIMDGVLKQTSSVDEAAICALNAGCDLLLLGGKLFAGEKAGFELTVDDVKRVHSSIVNAVNEGRISMARLDEAVERILRLKSLFLFVEENHRVGEDQDGNDFESAEPHENHQYNFSA